IPAEIECARDRGGGRRAHSISAGMGTGAGVEHATSTCAALRSVNAGTTGAISTRGRVRSGPGRSAVNSAQPFGSALGAACQRLDDGSAADRDAGFGESIQKVVEQRVHDLLRERLLAGQTVA